MSGKSSKLMPSFAHSKFQNSARSSRPFEATSQASPARPIKSMPAGGANESGSCSTTMSPSIHVTWGVVALFSVYSSDAALLAIAHQGYALMDFSTRSTSSFSSRRFVAVASRGPARGRTATSGKPAYFPPNWRNDSASNMTCSSRAPASIHVQSVVSTAIDISVPGARPVSQFLRIII